MEVLHIGDLAREARVSIETIRYYERRGLLSPPRRSPSGYREYTSADVDRLGFIRRAKALGFTLTETATLLESADDGSSLSVEQSAREKLMAIDEQRRELERTSRRLEALVELCAENDAACTDLRISC
jgi:DNA-binding transcriptional MerR regulator